MIESLEYTARIRPRAINKDGDDLPEDMHHDYTIKFDASQEHFTLEVRDDLNKVKSMPLNWQDLERINLAYASFLRMKGEAA